MRFTPSLLAAAAVLAVCSFPACTKSEPEKSAAAAPAAAPSTIQGPVLEILPATPYTYLRVKAAQGEVWAAVPAADIKVGANVTVLVQVRMEKFQSTTLNRTFDAVYMGTLGGDAQAAAAPAAMPGAAAAMPGAAAAMPGAMPGAPAAVPAAHGAAPAPALTAKVARATGADAHVISELYARKAELKDRAVTVKAQVTKSMGGILGKNWMHVSDGSGQPQSHDFDLVVTTLDTAKVGDVVTVKGVLHLNRDFGSGYVYPIIVEDAKLTR